MKKSLKIMIIILIILIIIIALILLGWKNKNSEGIDKTEKIKDSEFEVKEESQITKVTDDQEFFRASDCVQLYLDYLYDNNEEAVKTVLDKNYIENKNISGIDGLTGDIKEVLKNQDTEGVKFIPQTINRVEKSIDISVYFIEGNITDENYQNEKTSNFTVIIDTSKNVFSIIPENLEKENDYNYNLDIKDDTTDYYNEIDSEDISNVKILKTYYDYYQNLAINKPEKAFDLLDKDYREKRFNNEQSKYVEYLNNIDIKNLRLSKYLFNVYDDYTEYVAKNNDDSYFIINEKAPMDISLILDTHTIDVTQFTKKYNEGNEQIKMGMNIEKVIEAINQKDYQYVYSKLNDTFKQNNFSTLDSFIEYIQSNLFEYNNVEYDEFAQDGDTSIYKAIIKNSKAENENGKNITFVMKLLEDSNYVMSFSIE